MGSLPMVETLTTFFDWHRYYEMDGFQADIVRRGNADLFRWLLDKLCGEETPGSYCRLAGEAFSTDSPDMYAVWEEFLLDPTRRLAGASPYYHEGGEEPDPDGYFRPAETLIPQYNKRSVLFSSPAFCSAAKDAFCEARLFQTWQRLIDVLGSGPLNPRFLGWSLTRLAKISKPSISVAKELLRLGAPINFPRGNGGTIATTTTATTDAAPSAQNGRAATGPWPRTRRQTRHRGMTALHHAAHGTSEAAVRFARFLLEEGADPEYGFAGMKPAAERGAALMEKWLGESWEAVVARTEEARKERRKEEGKGEGYGESDEDEWKEEGYESDWRGEKANRRKSRQAGKRRKVDVSDNDDDDQVLGERDPTGKRLRSQRVTRSLRVSEKRNQ